ncbi:MAG TPA: molecular chaperone DnaK [Chthoniobacterales bacterium]|nr:molecular chaperone DnaK [Chthoniobacterales bacterium]
MSDIVGIDLGTTNSLVGIMEAGFPILLADADGERLVPSVVHFPAEGEPLVGRPAARMRALAPAETIFSIKRAMGSRTPVRVRERDLLPEEISALILRQLKANAEAALGREVTRAVITVPAYFNDAQRGATKRAGELAGFTVERIVNEPTAAALAYGLDKLKSQAKFAVYDLGGGTFDISILELNNGVFEVLATNGNTQLGGDDIDEALLGFVAHASGLRDLDRRATETLAPREAVIAAKHRLSMEERTVLRLPFLQGSESFELELTREKLEELSRAIVDRTRAHCLRALADAKIAPAELDEVILVGGVTRMPLVRRTVAEIFGREPNVSQNPDEAVALGATIQAGILSGALRDVILLDVTPLSLGIETFGGLMNVIIPRNSTIPVKAGEMFTTAVNNQRSMRIKVLQGEREMARDNWALGEFELQFEPAPKGVPRVGVQFEIDANGILHVLARDTKTGGEKTLEIQSAVDVSDEAVEAMLAESLEHAFEDMSERVWTEAKLKAEEMIGAVESAFRTLGDEVAAEDKLEIGQLVAEVRAALAAGEVQRLKKATAALDKATEPMAARLVERAMSTGKRL